MADSRDSLVNSIEKALANATFGKALVKAPAESLASTFEDIQQNRADLADHRREAVMALALESGMVGTESPTRHGQTIVRGTGNRYWDGTRVEILAACGKTNKCKVRKIYGGDVTWVDCEAVETDDSWSPELNEWVVRPCGRPGRVNVITTHAGQTTFGLHNTNTKFTLGTLKPWIPKVGDRVRFRKQQDRLPDWIVLSVDGGDVALCRATDGVRISGELPHLQPAGAASETQLSTSSLGELVAGHPVMAKALGQIQESPRPSDAIPDGWRELEPKEIPKRGDKFWHNQEWHELLVDGTLRYECYGGKHIRKIDSPKPAFAVGDRVKVFKAWSMLDGKEGKIEYIYGHGAIEVIAGDVVGLFDASDLQRVEAAK